MLINKKLKAKFTKGHVKKLSDVMVFFTLLKGFIGTGILFLPNGFHNAGWSFAVGALWGSMIMTLSSMILLVKVSEHTSISSFSELGEKALGKMGKYMWDITLAVSQAGFVTAGSVFIYQNMAKILEYRLQTQIPHWWIGVLCFIVYTPLTWVRKLQKFARFHLFADLTIITALIVIVIYSWLFIVKEGHFSHNVYAFNNDNYLIFVGTAIYAFEGVGIVLPVKDACQNPQNYVKVVSIMIVIIMAIYLTFGGFNYLVYGSLLLKDAPLITKLMPEGSVPIEIVFVLYFINIFISFPLVVHPTNIVLESYVFKNMKQSPVRKWLKNGCRTLVVALTIMVGLYLEESLDRFMSIIGSLACTPVAFMLPALLHYQLAANTKLEKTIDMTIIIVSVFLMIFITGYTFANWNE